MMVSEDHASFCHGDGNLVHNCDNDMNIICHDVTIWHPTLKATLSHVDDFLSSPVLSLFLIMSVTRSQMSSGPSGVKSSGILNRSSISSAPSLKRGAKKTYKTCWASRHLLGLEDEDLGSSPGW